jgi:predicted DNA-binding protein YlxM (UPF0122 family)
VNELEFKKENRMSACTAPPWAVFIPPRDRPEILRIIRQECIDIYGHSFDECPKRLTCFKKECIGRPLPWKSETARPYLEQLKATQDIRNEELYITTNCASCPIASICKSPCNQVLDFIEREKAVEPNIDYRNDTEQFKIVKENLEPANFLVGGEDIPWDVLPKRKQEVIKKYLYEGRDFRYVGETLGLNNQARAKYEFYAAITKLSEYAVVRNFLTNHYNELTVRQQQIFNMVYLDNRSFIDVAKDLQISKQSVQQTVARVLKKYNVTWKTYVKKRGNKVLYSVPQIFK